MKGLRSIVLMTVSATLPLFGCDKFMRLDVRVADGAGAPLAGATMRVVIARDGREILRAPTSEQGVVGGTTAYGFRSGPRTLSISKEDHKPFTVSVEPSPRYICYIVLRPEAAPESSSGRCEAE
jgi:hypothetical protein